MSYFHDIFNDHHIIGIRATTNDLLLLRSNIIILSVKAHIHIE